MQKQFLLLVGGFGESPYLRKRLKEAYADQGMDVVTVDEPSWVLDETFNWIPLNDLCVQEEGSSVSLEQEESTNSLNLISREGAALWFIKKLVVARAARFTVGLCTESFYKQEIESHKLREKLSYVSPMSVDLLKHCLAPSDALL